MKNHPLLITTLGLIALGGTLAAQNSVRIPNPLANLSPAQQKDLREQAADFFSAAKPSVATAAKSTVSISYRNNRIAYGTVVSVPDQAKPAILTKWSEVRGARSQLVITTSAGTNLPATVHGVYPEHDLALLQIKDQDAKLLPLNLKTSANPELGHFVVLANPEGEVEGFGVVSVKARSLRESDKAYLGVMMDFSGASEKGVPLKQVMRGSAADKAGLKNGDIIVTVDKTIIAGAMEMRNLLQRLKPGSSITITYLRGPAKKTTTVYLGSRAENEGIRRVPRERMERMQRMGAVPSRVRTDFPSVIQSDMPINPFDAGAPVADLDGNIVGIAIARGSRIKSYIIPTATIQKLLTTKPIGVSTAIAQGDTPRNRRPFERNYRRNISPNNNTTPRAIPAEREADEGELDRVRRLLEQARQTNEENAENLRKIERALRDIERSQSNGR